MKKRMNILYIVLSLVLVLGLAGCSSGNDAPAPADQAETPTPVKADATDADASMTVEEFCEFFEGTWMTDDGYFVYIGFQTETGEPFFVWGIENSDANYGPGAITNFEVLDENEYQLTVDYEGVDGEVGFSYDAFTSNVHIDYREEEGKMLAIKFDDQPEAFYYFDFNTSASGFKRPENFLGYIFENTMSEIIIDPDTDNYVQFFDIGGSPRFLFGTLGFNEDSGIGEITEMVLDGEALVITVVFPAGMANGGPKPELTTEYTVRTIAGGISVETADGYYMGDFYFGVG